jgi:hypothetical protein
VHLLAYPCRGVRFNVPAMASMITRKSDVKLDGIAALIPSTCASRKGLLLTRPRRYLPDRL